VTVTLTRPTPESILDCPELLELFEDPDNEWWATWDDLDHSMLSELVWHGNEHGLFGVPFVSFWTTADGDGINDGGLITVDLGPRIDAIRLCSLHQDLRDLVDDRDAQGRELGADVLRNVKRVVDELRANFIRQTRGGE
jgi:hypothetical protein